MQKSAGVQNGSEKVSLEIVVATSDVTEELTLVDGIGVE